ncbi:MAG: DUF4190 domain-containing protein [Candidatus Thermoplasmatota archaeon]|nr:DUF4190 domain-containing protein [Candidatus Thermoplasmatota archaeon]
MEEERTPGQSPGTDQGHERDQEIMESLAERDVPMHTPPPRYAASPPVYEPGHDTSGSEDRDGREDALSSSPFDTGTNTYDKGAKGMGAASMIIGICSLGTAFLGILFSGFCCISFMLSITGLVLGSVSLVKYKRTGAVEGKGMAIAGVIMNSIDLGLAFLGMLILLLALGVLVGTGFTW